MFSAIGVGGSRLALDAAGDVFIAGTAEFQYPTSPGAFQTTYTPFLYFPSGLITIGSSEVPAGEQYVTKLSADGSQLLYSTFVTGSMGAWNAGMAVDASGDVWLTGDTVSPDYPYAPALAAPPTSQTFTTELDPTGSKVLLSVPVGVPPGNGSNLAFDPQGDLIAVGAFPIPVLSTFPANAVPAPPGPSAGNVRAECLPGATPYILHISSKDGSILGTRILSGYRLVGWGSSEMLVSSTVDSQGNVYLGGIAGLPDIPLTPGVVYDSSVTQRVAFGAFLERTNFGLPASPIGCVTDAANWTLIGPVAPGQLLTLFGNGIGPSNPVSGLIAGESSVPTALGGLSVTFDGQPAPILYASSTQINIQAPFEISQNPSTVMQVNYNGQVLGTRMFAVVPQNPGLFATAIPSAITCGQTQIAASSLVALAINEDGSINSCANPAPVRSLLSLFLNGIGTLAANQTTGSFTGPSPAFDRGSAEVGLPYFGGRFGFYAYAGGDVGFTDQPNAISGIGQVRLRVPEDVTSIQPVNVALVLSGPAPSSTIAVGPLEPGYELGVGATSVPGVIWVGPGKPPGIRPRAVRGQ